MTDAVEPKTHATIPSFTGVTKRTVARTMRRIRRGGRPWLLWSCTAVYLLVMYFVIACAFLIAIPERATRRRQRKFEARS